jgi:hypothetical protein
LNTHTTWRIKVFVAWYNTQHLHSGIRFVTPEDRHGGREIAILAARKNVYAAARAAHPERWSNGTRNWAQVAEVRLNPPKSRQEKNEPTEAAA